MKYMIKEILSFTIICLLINGRYGKENYCNGKLEGLAPVNVRLPLSYKEYKVKNNFPLIENAKLTKIDESHLKIDGAKLGVINFNGVDYESNNMDIYSPSIHKILNNVYRYELQIHGVSSDNKRVTIIVLYEQRNEQEYVDKFLQSIYFSSGKIKNLKNSESINIDNKVDIQSTINVEYYLSYDGKIRTDYNSDNCIDNIYLVMFKTIYIGQKISNEMKNIEQVYYINDDYKPQIYQNKNKPKEDEKPKENENVQKNKEEKPKEAENKPNEDEEKNKKETSTTTDSANNIKDDKEKPKENNKKSTTEPKEQDNKEKPKEQENKEQISEHKPEDNKLKKDDDNNKSTEEPTKKDKTEDNKDKLKNDEKTENKKPITSGDKPNETEIKPEPEEIKPKIIEKKIPKNTVNKDETTETNLTDNNTTTTTIIKSLPDIDNTDNKPKSKNITDIPKYKIYEVYKPTINAINNPINLTPYNIHRIKNINNYPKNYNFNYEGMPNEEFGAIPRNSTPFWHPKFQEIYKKMPPPPPPTILYKYYPYYVYPYYNETYYLIKYIKVHLNYTNKNKPDNISIYDNLNDNFTIMNISIQQNNPVEIMYINKTINNNTNINVPNISKNDTHNTLINPDYENKIDKPILVTKDDIQSINFRANNTNNNNKIDDNYSKYRQEKVCVKWLLGTIVNRVNYNKEQWNLSKELKEDSQYYYCGKFKFINVPLGMNLPNSQKSSKFDLLDFCNKHLDIIVNLNPNDKEYLVDNLKLFCEGLNENNITLGHKVAYVTHSLKNIVKDSINTILSVPDDKYKESNNK